MIKASVVFLVVALLGVLVIGLVSNTFAQTSSQNDAGPNFSQSTVAPQSITES